mgnify:CR=1 FL=1
MDDQGQLQKFNEALRTHKRNYAASEDTIQLLFGTSYKTYYNKTDPTKEQNPTLPKGTVLRTSIWIQLNNRTLGCRKKLTFEDIMSKTTRLKVLTYNIHGKILDEEMVN